MHQDYGVQFLGSDSNHFEVTHARKPLDQSCFV